MERFLSLLNLIGFFILTLTTFAQVPRKFCRDRARNLDDHCICRLDKAYSCKVNAEIDNGQTKCSLILENLNITYVSNDFKLEFPNSRDDACDELDFQWINMDTQSFGALVTELPRIMTSLTTRAMIGLDTLPKLNSDDFQTLVDNINVQESVDLTISALSSFQNASSKAINFEKFGLKIDQLRIVDSRVVLNIESPFVPWYEESLDIAGGKYSPACLNILVPKTRKRFSLTWATEQMFPQVFRETRPSDADGLELKVFFNGDSSILYKELLAYASPIAALHISLTVNRIEYGTLGTAIHELPKCIVSRFDEDENCLDDEEKVNFIDGDCDKLKPRTCEICYMHQKGLHREKDFLEEICRNNNKSFAGLQKCFWRPPQPIPEELHYYHINRSDVNPNFPLCPKNLITTELDNIPCASSTTLEPPSIITTTEPQTLTASSTKGSPTTGNSEPKTTRTTEFQSSTTAISTKPPKTTKLTTLKPTTITTTSTTTAKPGTTTTTISAGPETSSVTISTDTPTTTMIIIDTTTTTTTNPATTTEPTTSITTTKPTTKATTSERTTSTRPTTSTTTSSETNTTTTTTTGQNLPVPCTKLFESKGTPNCWCLENIAQFCSIESSVLSDVTKCKLDIGYLVIDAFSATFYLEPREQECDNFKVKLEYLPVKYLGGFGAEAARHWLKVKKSAKISFNNIWKLNTSDLENNLRLMVKNEYKPIFEVEIDSSFLQNSSNLHVSKFSDNYDKVLLNNLYNNFVTEDPFVMNNNSGLIVQNSMLAQDFVNIIITNNQNSEEIFLDWNNKQFFPQLYKEIASKNVFNINLTGSVVYLQKEVLFNIGTIETLKIGKNIRRIEYGSIATPKEMLVNNFIDPNTNQEYFLKSYDKDNFLRSRCSEMSLKFLCEICYMHQYGLHKSKNNISALCEAKIVPEFPLEKCYWRDVQPIPDSLCHYNVDQSRLIDEEASGVRTCAAIPADIQDFLNTLPKQRGECVVPTTSPPTITSSGKTTYSTESPITENPNIKTTTTAITPSPTGCKPINPKTDSSVNICTCKDSTLTSCSLQIEQKQRSNIHCSLGIKNIDIKNISNSFKIETTNKQTRNCSQFSLVIENSPISKFGNLAQVTKNPLLNSESGLLTFKNLPDVTAFDLEKLLEQITEKTDEVCQQGKIPAAKLSLQVETVFQNYIQEDYFDISSFYDRFENIAITNLFKPLSFTNPLILKNTENVHFDENLFKDELNFVAFSGNQSQIYWENYDYYPQFYRIVETNKNNNKTVHEIFLNGSSNYLLKEVFVYSGDVKTIGINSNVQRIEYGALANTKKLRTNCFKNLSSDQSQKVCVDKSEHDKTNFLNGNCTKLSEKFLCEICLMHQFGLHKTINNVTQLCNGTSEYRLMPRKCYWQPLQPVPVALRDYQIAESFIDQSIEECDYIFTDVRRFLDASYKVYSSERY